jgi:L-threonylcarbamoyladenylate synthase
MPSPALAAALAQLAHPGAHIVVLAHSVAQPPDFEGTWFDAPSHDTAYAQQLYANLRALDALAADEIWIEAPPDGPEWHAVRDRLRRATERD